MKHIEAIVKVKWILTLQWLEKIWIHLKLYYKRINGNLIEKIRKKSNVWDTLYDLTLHALVFIMIMSRIGKHMHTPMRQNVLLQINGCVWHSFLINLWKREVLCAFITCSAKILASPNSFKSIRRKDEVKVSEAETESKIKRMRFQIRERACKDDGVSVFVCVCLWKMSWSKW